MRTLLCILLLGCGSGAPSSSSAQTGTQSEREQAMAAVGATRRTAITAAVERAASSVVTVQTEAIERVPVDPFEAFFGGRSGERVIPGLGSGFIVDPNGIIVTNAHVVGGATTVSIATRDGTSYPARIVGVDETNDLAVLRIDATGLPVAPIGRSIDLLIGEWAIAIGNPYGFLLGNTEPSVSAGVISAVGRNLVGGGAGAGAHFDMIQTDAAINPGNSGGPLVNALGEVIGVNSSIYSPSGGSVGLGFAIPIDRVMHVVEEITTYGAVRRPWIGVQLQLPATGNPRDALTAGATVRAVVPESPAARAGIRPGDVLVQSRDRVLRNVFDWEAELLDLRVGEEISLLVRRGGSERTVTLTVADLPEVSAEKVEVLRELELVTLTPAIRAERNLRSARGALVYRVSPRMSSELGVQPGDVIVQVNRTPVASADDVARAIEQYSGRGPIRIFFEHGGRIFTSDVLIQ